MSVTNPYQPFFDKLDATVAALDEDPTVTEKDAAELLRRAGFVLANLLNVNAQALPALILPPEPEADTGGDPSNQSPGTT